ncbi:MAG: LemA family protein [Candidatus Micrarchaeota archaeon]|nr:LemA family protein [Candidatus Micrarchaeota archaeon]
MALDIVLIAIGAVIVLGVIILFWLYNSLISKKMRVDNAWSQIDVQLTKRYELVPNLVETVKGYAKHEKEIFENVAAARTAWANAKTVGEKAKADSSFAGALKSIMAVSENYPDLKANENFKMLQEQLDGIESKVAYARQFYNDSVMDYNTAIAQMPQAMVAGMLGFAPKEYFKADSDAVRAPVKVKF